MIIISFGFKLDNQAGKRIKMLEMDSLVKRMLASKACSYTKSTQIFSRSLDYTRILTQYTPLAYFHTELAMRTKICKTV